MLGSGWGELGSRKALAAQAVRAALCVLLFVLCIHLICVVVVIVLFVCCSAKLPLSRPTSFCLFLSVLLRTPAGGGAAAAKL